MYMALAAFADWEGEPQAFGGGGQVTADFRLEAKSPPGPAPAAVVGWIAAHAIALTSADLSPLRALIGDAQLVALGEATYGTREFIQLNQRILEFLVSKMGFTALAIEASMPECFDLDDYVSTGKGDPQKALAALYSWTANSEELLETIEWMRRYNADPTHINRIHLYGLDMQHPVHALNRALAYLARVDPPAAAEHAQALAPLTERYAAEKLLRARSRTSEFLAAASALVARLDERRHAYGEQTSPAAWSLARQEARLVQQYFEIAAAAPAQGDVAARERTLAENVRWIVEHEGAGKKLLLFSHNDHLSRSPDPRGPPGPPHPLKSMGGLLHEHFGDKLLIIGSEFNRGGFQAVEAAGDHLLRPFVVTAAPEGSVGATLAAARLPLYAVDLRDAPPWFASRHAAWDIGVAFDEAAPAHSRRREIVAGEYDALVFAEETSPAHQLPRGRRSAVPTLARPANLDFEAGGTGAPANWYAPADQDAFGYRAGITSERPHSGASCAIVERSEQPRYGEGYGSLLQRIDARPFRGRRVRLRAYVRALVSGEASRVLLTLRVGKSGGGPPLYSADSTDRATASAKWQSSELIATIAGDADSITYGLLLIGDGKAFLDDVAIDPLSN
jgi:erythromycin esterase